MEYRAWPEEENGTAAVLSDLVRWIAILAAPHGYVASARLLGGAEGNRLQLQARQRTGTGQEYLQELSLATLETVGVAAVGSAFDQAARAAFAAGPEAEQPTSRPAQG
jgi:hypothetical protein